MTYTEKIQQLVRFAEKQIKAAEENNEDETASRTKRYWQGYIKGIQAAAKMIGGGDG